MSAPTHAAHSFPNLFCATEGSVPGINWAEGQHKRNQSLNSLASSLIDRLERSGQWAQWAQVEPRLGGFASLEEVRAAWRVRDQRCYQVVAGLTALGSRRGADDDDAALAVVVLLEGGVNRVALTLADVCEIDDVGATVWEEVKAAEPQLGAHAARYLLKRARQRLIRPSAGMVSRLDTTSLEARAQTNNGLTLGLHSDGSGREDRDRDLVLAVAPVEDPVEDLVDLLTWATGAGVIGAEDVGLLVELMAAENSGMGREEAQRVVGERRGVGMRTIRRRTTKVTELLADAAPKYLAAIA